MINEFYVCDATLTLKIKGETSIYQIWVNGKIDSFVIYEVEDIESIFIWCKINTVHLNNFELIQ